MENLNSTDKTVSIIIPCRNEEQYIEECMLSFIEMDYPNELLEIIVVDGNSSDRTRSLIEKFQKTYPLIKLIPNPKTFTPFALNIGIKSASGNFIMIASAHSSFSKNYIKDLVQAFEILNADGVGGVMLTEAKNKTKKNLSICKVLSNKFGVGNSLFRLGTDQPMQVDTVPFGIYKKDLLIKIGLYYGR